MALKGDKQLKQERGYRGKSYVRPDGSEVLFGIDWEVRKRELWNRADGRCERRIGIEGGIKVRCSREGWIPAHIEPRHPNRDDRLTNLLLLCAPCDKILEKQSWRKPRFGEKTKPVVKRRHSESQG